MGNAYANGEFHNTEDGQKKTARFTDFAQGMGLAVVSAVTAKEAVKEFKQAQANRTVTEVDSAWGGREGEVAVNLNKHDAAGIGMVMAAGIVVYSSRDKLKKAFVYGARKAKQFGSFVGAAIDGMQKFTQEYVAEDLKNPEKPTVFNKLNKIMGRTGR